MARPEQPSVRRRGLRAVRGSLADVVVLVALAAQAALAVAIGGVDRSSLAVAVLGLIGGVALAGRLVLGPVRSPGADRDEHGGEDDGRVVRPTGGRGALLSRAGFERELEHALAGLTDERLAVAVVELADFEEITDAIGYEHGNHLLDEVSARLRPSLRDLDAVGRIGLDEFAVMVTGESQRSLHRVAEHLVWLFEEPFEVGGRSYQLQVSVGLAVAGPDQAHGAELIQAASVALHHARNQGTNEVAVYEESLRHQVEERLQLNTELRAALATGQFRLVYQPLVHLSTNQIASFEALLRWDHPELGAIPPSTFIPLAERSGTIVELGRWAVGQACRQLVDWCDRFDGFDDVAMGVNLSVRQLEHHGELDALLYLVEGAGLDHRSLIVELTESVMIDDRSWIGSQLQHLRRLGARIAIDDFGTGVAGLSHLRELPYDVVKIDRSYVDQVGTGSPGEQLVAQIIELAKGLGATLVAEGIETPEQLARLTEMGCDVGQGFHLARPMPAEELERWMVEGGRARPVNRRLSAGTGG